MDRSHYYNETSTMSRDTRSDYHYLMAEMKAQNYDVIRFATYRTASKLRFIQKKTNLHLVDIWNIIEAFRENGLNSLDSRLEITVSRLESLVASIYFQLNKRLPLQQQIDVEHSSAVLMNWLLATYDPEDIGNVRVFSVKTGLAIVCAGKITDKLRYIFSLISDVNGLLVFSKFADFLKEAMALPCSVYESPSFYYTDSLPRTVFDGQTAVTVNDFLSVMLSDPGPQCLMWFPLLHRMASVENVLHTVQCDGCNRVSFFGFRYKCQRCYNYQLCQDCFWRGRVSGNHTNQHEMKEYTSYKTPSKQLSHSLKKSFRCVPEKPSTSIPRYPAKPERTLNLAHIVPPTPVPTHNGFPEQFESSQYDGELSRKGSQNLTNYDFYPGDEEHRLISRYANHLTHNSGESRSPSEISVSSDTMKQRELIAKLEAKNREIMREIIRLRKQQEQEDVALRSEQNPTLLAELRALRQKKEELENHLSGLQESRRELVLQLEALMRMLKTHSPHSTPNSSPLSLMSRSPPVYPLSSMSAPTTPGSNAPYGESLMGLGGDVRSAFGQAGSTRSLQNDLLLAADSVTSAMSSLVKELNYGCDDEGISLGGNQLLYSRELDPEGPLDELNIGDSYWSDEDEIHGRHSSQYFGDPRTTSILAHQVNDSRETDLFDSMDPEIYQGQGSLTTDDESYVRTDEEEGGGTDWEDNMRRWVNR